MFWSWTTGERLTPAKLNAFVSLYKGVDQTVSGSVLTNDNDLVFPVAANEVWAFQCNILYSAHNGNHMKCAFTFPSGSVMPWGKIGLNTGAAIDNIGFDNPASGTPTGINGTGSGNTLTVVFYGTVFNGSTAGSVFLQFAQNGTGTGGQVARMRKGSHLFAHRLD